MALSLDYKERWMAEGPDQETLEFLHGHEMFAHFSAGERAHLSSSAALRVLFPGEAICREGGAANEWYLLLEGQARVTRTRPDGGQELIAILDPGALFGLVGLLDGGRRPATTTALQPGRCLTFPRSLLEGEPNRFTHCVIELHCMALNSQLRAVNQRLASIAQEVSNQQSAAGGRVFGGWRLPTWGR